MKVALSAAAATTAFVEENVLRLDVAMDDLVTVRVVQRVGDFAGDAHRLLNRQRAARVDPVAQRLPLHHRHHIEEKAVGFPRVVQRQDVRMGQSRGEADLADESLAAE